MRIGLKCKIDIAILTLTPETSEPDNATIAKIKELVIKTFKEHIKISDLSDIDYEVDVIPGQNISLLLGLVFLSSYLSSMS